jgi:hypothetical protein
MASGEMLEFLVPNALLRPPEDHLPDIVILNKHRAEQAAAFGTTTLPPLPPPPQQQQPQRQAPPAHPHPPAFGAGRGAAATPPGAGAGIPDYSQSAYSSEPPEASKGGVKETAEKAWANFSSGFSSIFGQSAHPARPHAAPLLSPSSPPSPHGPRFTPQASPPHPTTAAVRSPEPEVALDPSAVQQLKDMGFGEDLAVAALVANRGMSSYTAAELWPSVCFCLFYLTGEQRHTAAFLSRFFFFALLFALGRVLT